jgi:hypothetical protein
LTQIVSVHPVFTFLVIFIYPAGVVILTLPGTYAPEHPAALSSQDVKAPQRVDSGFVKYEALEEYN